MHPNEIIRAIYAAANGLEYSPPVRAAWGGTCVALCLCGPYGEA